MNHPQILAIIINWRQPETTVECVQAVQAMNDPPIHILVVDNGSGDHSLAYFQEHLPQIEILDLPTNLGFAGGANAGLRKAIDKHLDYALLINNDAFPALDMMEKLMGETADSIALLSPKILYQAEPNRIWFAGGRQDPILLELRDRGQGQPDGDSWAASKDVDYLLGTCLLVNLKAVSHIGLLDEQYFMYYEDLDWSIRFRKAGYRLRLVADAHLFHRVAVSSGGEDTPSRRYHLARSSVYFFWRHAQNGHPKRILIFRFLSGARTFGRLLLNGKWGTAAAYLRGLKDGWRLATFTKKRKI